MLDNDPVKRIKAIDVLNHPWFQLNPEALVDIYQDVSTNLRQTIKEQNIALNLLAVNTHFFIFPGIIVLNKNLENDNKMLILPRP